MKITIDIECTPEEARTFLGLPDVKALQDSFMEDYKVKLQEAMNSMNPQQIVSNMMSGTGSMADALKTPNATGADVSSLQDMQKAFWSNMMSMANQKPDADDK